MNSMRKSEKNRIREEIRSINGFIDTDNAAIARLRYQTGNIEYTKTQIQKLKQKNEDRQETLKSLEQRIVDLEDGLLDQELENEYDQVKSEIERKENEARVKREQENADQKIKNQKSKQFYESGRASDQLARSLKHEMHRGYKYYLKICDSVPDYMIKKLKEMPNNKGYIWRGMYCYGELDAEPGEPDILFEKNKDLLIIHEWTGSEYKIWHKKGKGRKSLQSVTKYTSKSIGMGNLFDYVK